MANVHPALQRYLEVIINNSLDIAGRSLLLTILVWLLFTNRVDMSATSSDCHETSPSDRLSIYLLVSRQYRMCVCVCHNIEWRALVCVCHNRGNRTHTRAVRTWRCNVKVNLTQTHKNSIAEHVGLLFFVVLAIDIIPTYLKVVVITYCTHNLNKYLKDWQNFENIFLGWLVGIHANVLNKIIYLLNL